MNKRHDKYQLIVGKLQHDSSPDRTSDFSLSTLEKMKHTTSSSSSQLKFSLFFARSCSKGRKTHTRGFSLSQHTRTRRCWLEPIKKRAQLDGFAHMLHQLDKLQLDENLCQHPQYRTGQRRKNIFRRFTVACVVTSCLVKLTWVADYQQLEQMIVISRHD